MPFAEVTETALHVPAALSEHDQEDDKDGNGRVAFNRVDIFVSEQGDDEGDEGDDDNAGGFRKLVLVGNGQQGRGADDGVDGGLRTRQSALRSTRRLGSRRRASGGAVKQGKVTAGGEATLTHPMQARAFSTMGNQMA